MFSSSTSIMSGWDSMYDTASDNSFANLLFEALLHFICAICQTFWQSQYFALSSNFLNHGCWLICKAVFDIWALH